VAGFCLGVGHGKRNPLGRKRRMRCGSRRDGMADCSGGGPRGKAGNFLPACGGIRPLCAMKSARSCAVALVTAPDLKTARLLAQAALKAKLVACANLIPRLESHYWWQGKLERSSEVLILFKTVKARLSALEKLVLAKHPYDTPEFIVLPMAMGAERYLRWIEEEAVGG